MLYEVITAAQAQPETDLSRGGMAFAVALRADVPGLEHARQEVGDLLGGQAVHGLGLLLLGTLLV